MAFIDWNPAWSVGNAIIDMDHQMLVSITNELMDMRRRRGITNADVRRMLDRLIEYTERHFAREEEMFLATDYPDAAKHMAMHRHLSKTIRDIAALYAKEGDTLHFSSTTPLTTLIPAAPK